MASTTDRPPINKPGSPGGSAPPASDRAVAGTIEAVTGQVFILKLDGSRVGAAVGAAVVEGDILVTQTGGGVTVDFGRATVALGAEARMLVESGGSLPVFFVLQGPFAVQAAAAAAGLPDQVTVRTPVTTAILRRGRMLGRAAAEAVSNAFVLLPNPDGRAGDLTVTTAAGTVVLDRPLQATSVVSLFRAPQPAIDRDLASLRNEFGGSLAGWLIPAPVAARTLAAVPDRLTDLLAQTGEALAERGSRLLNLVFPPAAAAAAIEQFPDPLRDNTFIPSVSPASGAPLAFSYLLSGGSASFQGGIGFDMLSLTANETAPNRLTFGRDDQNRVVISDEVNGFVVLLNGIEELSVTLGTVSDKVTIGDLSGTDIADSTVIIHAGNGDDTVDGAAAGKRLVLFGDGGNDSLIGGNRNDDLLGGAGNDTLTGNAGNDLLDGGDGNDTVSFAAAGGPVVTNLATGVATGDGNDTLTSIENLIGSAFGDALTGDGNANRLDGGGGDDTLAGGGGDDTLSGGDGGDTASFATASQAVNASLLTNTASGPGSITLSSIENLSGSAQADTLTGDESGNRIAGGGGNDSIDARGGNDLIVWNTGDGLDTIDGGSGSDTLAAAISGTASLAASGATAVLSATGSASTTGVETVRITGGSGNDTLTIGALSGTSVSQLQLDGGSGSDSVSFASFGVAVTIDLAAGTMAGWGSIAGFEAVTGSALADTLLGSGAAETLDGGGGNDSLDARGGDDLLRWSTGQGNDTIAGGNGDDSLNAGITGSVTLSRTGSTGTLTGTGSVGFTGIEHLRITGSSGNDTVSFGDVSGTGLATIDADGGAGSDSASFANALTAVTVDLAAGTATGLASLQNFEAITGSNFNDTLLGGTGNDTLSGSGGNDSLDGRGGNDSLTGGGGDDTILGGDGNDTITGGTGSDSIDAGIGNDLVSWSTGDGNDTITGGNGTDTLDVSFGGATVTLDAVGGAVRVTAGAEVLSAAQIEILRLFASGGNDSVVIGTNIVINSLTGSGLTAADVQIHGNGGNDRLDGSGSALTLGLFGDDGNDTLLGGSGNDTLNGGNDTDTADFSLAANAVSVDLAAGTATGSGNDQLSAIERLIGSAFDDTLLGGAGGETLIGGLGDDSLDGRGGFDTVDYSGASSAVAIDLSVTAQATTGGLGTDSLTGIEGVVGTGFDDTLTGNGSANLLTGGAGNDSLIGGDGDDTLVAGTGSDTLEGGNGTDTADLSARTGNLVIDLTDPTVGNLTAIENLIGGSGNDSVTGTSGANLLQGGAGSDTLIGAAGNDTLMGGGGTDRLIGGAGADLLSGSNGEAQVFRYNGASEGADTITAFESGTDTIDVSGGGFGVASITDGVNFFAAAAGDSLGVSGPAFLFDAGTGTLAYDSDGDGVTAAVTLATVQTGTILAADLHVF